jgi:uncharacterized membrane protein
MTFFKLTLTSHWISGFLGLIIGAISMWAPKYSKLHKRSGIIYVVLMSYVILTSILLSFMNWERNWWLFLIALFSYYFCLTGYLAVKRKRPGWITQHLTGMLGSYVAMVTAFVVLNIKRVPGSDFIPYVAYWFLPTLIAMPFIRRVKRRWAHIK